MNAEPGEVRAGRPRWVRRIRRMVLIVLVTIAGAYVAWAALLYLFQSRLVFFPDRKLEATPASEGWPFEDVFVTSGGVRIHGWFIPAADNASRGMVLFCHGNAGNISHRLDTVRILRRLGMDVLVFDYRGYGRSEGSPTEQGTYDDAQAMWNWLVNVKGRSPSRIVIHGRSLGGGVAAELATRVNSAGLILESTATCADDLAAEEFPWVPARLLCRFDYDARRRLARIRCPVLIVHGKADELVPFHHGEELFAAAHEPKRFLELSGGHGTGFLTAGDVYTDGLRDFFAQVLH